MYVRPHLGRGSEVPGPRLPEVGVDEPEAEAEWDAEAVEGLVVGARRGAGVGIGLDGIGIVASRRMSGLR